MGKVLSVIQRKVYRFNAENRAHRIISKDKPTPAPRYPSTIKELETIKSDYPHILEEQYKKDSKLDGRLKQVYVHSYDPIVAEQQTTNSSHSLPQDRRPLEETEFGYTEPMMIPQGRFTLKQAMKFIADHHADPNTWTATAIAKEYNINQDKLETILFYYRMFQVHIPEGMGKKIPVKLNTMTEETKNPQMLQSDEEKMHHEQK
ncbi:protein NDUFAF4 homolog [Zootermopsis nevadensis]|uniref:NDUFAF4-like protein n=1 Tax=Zootermopsis nevadensis TaxID=136037 RepID=A0A067QV36_ZOONE|nr:protein NDUFAF4 homolog [Zootermopsis nevadensis]KDR08215.1 NDUFAF4-like protein [Zootermopsis nevadensis]